MWISSENLIDPGEVLRREEVTLVAEVARFPIDDEFVGHAAGLGAFATVRAALAERLAREALSRVGDAEGAVDEGLELHRSGRVWMKEPDLAHRVFAGDDGAVEIEKAMGEVERLGRGDRHLRRGVEMQIGHHGPGHRGEPEILHDDRVHTCVAEEPQLLRRILEFLGKNERVEGNEPPHPVGVEEVHQLRQVLRREIVRPDPRVEAGHAEIDRIRPVRHGSARAVPVARRGEQFGGSFRHRTR
jgi:hypothetical protein